jgi:hypothetical protein
MNLKIKYLRYIFAKPVSSYDTENMFEHFSSLLRYENTTLIPTPVSLVWSGTKSIYETYYRR